MNRGIVVLFLSVAFASSAYAASGDARLIQGTLEWPAKLANEAFLIARADDGRWYYVEIQSVKRIDSGPLTKGSPIAFLGLEADKPYEIRAVAIGGGDAAALVLALMPQRGAGRSPAPGASAPVSSASASPVPAPRVPTHVAPAEKPAAPAEKSAAPARGGVVPRPQPAPVQIEPASTPSPSGWPADTRRWTDVRGTVKAVSGNSMIVSTSDGQLVTVDLSSVTLAENFLTPGASIALYGLASERGFQAMGLLEEKEPEKRPLAKPVPGKKSSKNGAR